MKFLLLATVASLALIVYAVNKESSPATAQIEQKKTEMVDTAEIGDSVVVNYPASTIMCSDRTDVSKVYMTGKFTMWQEMRVTNDAWKAVKAEQEARKYAMRTAYSCRWAPSGNVHFIVVEKHIIGTEKDIFHVIDYCLQAEDKNTCWWITEDFGATSRFIKDVQRRTKTETAESNTETH